MKKSNEQKVSNMLNNINEILMDNNSLQDDDPQSLFKNIYRCPECYTIPLMKIQENENKITLNCLNNHEIEMLFSQYMSNQFKQKKEKIECSNCGTFREDLENFIYCQNCQNFFCNECAENHENNEPSHNMIDIKNMDNICPEHKNPYTHFCQDCQKNLCDDCVKEHTSHQLILLENIILSNEEFNETKNNIMKENETLLKIQSIFKDTVDTLTRKFNDIMAYKFLCLKYKDNIVNTYQVKNINYQVIKNVNNLKYLTGGIKIEPEMNELDIIYELFNFLDSVEYNENNDISNKKINQEIIMERDDENDEKNSENELSNRKISKKLEIESYYIPEKDKKNNISSKTRHFKVTKESILKNTDSFDTLKSQDNLDYVLQNSISSFPENNNTIDKNEKSSENIKNLESNENENNEISNENESKSIEKDSIRKPKKFLKKRKKKLNVDKEKTNFSNQNNIKTNFIYEKKNIKSKENLSSSATNEEPEKIQNKTIEKTIEETKSIEDIDNNNKEKKKSRKKVIKKKINKNFVSDDLLNDIYEDPNKNASFPIINKSQKNTIPNQKKVLKKKVLLEKKTEITSEDTDDRNKIEEKEIVNKNREETSINTKKKIINKRKVKKTPIKNIVNNIYTNNKEENIIKSPPTEKLAKSLTQKKKLKKKLLTNPEIEKTKSEQNIKLNKSQKIRMAENKGTTAILLENSTKIYVDESKMKKGKKVMFDIKKMKTYTPPVKERIDSRFKKVQTEEEFIIARSGSFKKSNKYVKFNHRDKINSLKFENGVSCILEINPFLFAVGNLIGDIKILNSKTYNILQTISVHEGTIISLCLLHDQGILSCSADRKMLKIKLFDEGKSFKIEFVFHGYENYILKAIELSNSNKIVTCSWDDKLFIWDPNYDSTKYANIFRINDGERVEDLLEISNNYFVTVSDNNELKKWNSKTFKATDIISNIKCITSPNSICKINEVLLCVIDYHAIQLVNISEGKLINTINIDDGNLSCIIKLKDNSILTAQDFNTDKYCIFYIKQFFYEKGDLIPISYKKDKFYKTNKNNDKEIRALVQFRNEVIVQGVTGEYNGKDSGDIFFYY